MSPKNSDPPVLIAADNEIETDSTSVAATSRIGWFTLIFYNISKFEIPKPVISLARSSSLEAL